MLKRLRWTVIGAGAGVAGYLWLTRRARERVPKAGVDAVRQVRETGRELGSRLREALEEGRSGFRDRREDLSRELLPRER